MARNFTAARGRWDWRSALLAALVACWGLCLADAGVADTLDTIRQRGTLIWGADAEGGGPYVYPRDDDPAQVEGFEVELAAYLAQQLGVRSQFAQGQWDKLPELLDRGDIDIVLNGYEWKSTWSDRFGISLPYYIYELQLLGHRQNAQLGNWEDLQAAVERGERPRVAVLGASAAAAYLESRFGGRVDLALYDGNTDAMRAVELGIDGVVATLQDLPIAIFYEERFRQLRRLGDPVAPGYYVLLTRRNDLTLVQSLNQAILTGYQSGEIPKILERYRLWNDTQARRGLTVDARGNFSPQRATNLSPTAATVTSSATSGWGRSLGRLPLLLQGALLTVLLSVTSMPLAVGAGVWIALGRLYGPLWLRPFLTAYVELVRGTPLVLQLYLIFFLLPELGLSLPAFLAAVLGLAINYSAYEAEIYRAGLQAVPRGQMEAALSLGMTRAMALRRVIVPQAARLVIPPVMNDFIALFKDTAVCSVITVVELSKQYYIHAQSTGSVVELGLVTGALYLAMSYPLTILVNRWERRLGSAR